MPTDTLDPDLRTILDGTALAHLATVGPDGAPHGVPLWVGTHGEYIVVMTGPGSRKARNLRHDPRLVLSLVAPDNPFQPIVIRGRVVEWLTGDDAWPIVDMLATTYIGMPYPRDQERVGALIEPERHTIGIG